MISREINTCVENRLNKTHKPNFFVTPYLLSFLGIFYILLLASGQYLYTHHPPPKPSRVAHNSSVLEQIKQNLILNTSQPNAIVQAQMTWYQNHPYYLPELLRRARPYLFYIYQETLKQHLPTEIALLPLIESNFNPFVFSSAGATGIWQLMPTTAHSLGVPMNWWYDGRRDIIIGTQAALSYLTYLHKRFQGDWLLAIAAYNSGEHTVLQARLNNKKKGLPTDFWHLPLPGETRAYMTKLLAISHILGRPHQYHLKFDRIPYQPYFTQIHLKHSVDIQKAAALSHLSVKAFRYLNPGFRRNKTGHCNACTLLVPVEQKPFFLKKLSRASSKQRYTCEYYTVKPEDTLSDIAKQFRMKTKRLKNVNHLSNAHYIQVHQKLCIPYQNTKNGLSFPPYKQNNITEDTLPGLKLRHYTVRAHDNWASIANQHGITLKQLAYWNSPIYLHHPPKLGQKLNIWHQTHKP